MIIISLHVLMPLLLDESIEVGLKFMTVELGVECSYVSFLFFKGHHIWSH